MRNEDDPDSITLEALLAIGCEISGWLGPAWTLAGNAYRTSSRALGIARSLDRGETWQKVWDTFGAMAVCAALGMLIEAHNEVVHLTTRHLEASGEVTFASQMTVGPQGAATALEAVTAVATGSPGLSVAVGGGATGTTAMRVPNSAKRPRGGAERPV